MYFLVIFTISYIHVDIFKNTCIFCTFAFFRFLYLKILPTVDINSLKTNFISQWNTHQPLPIYKGEYLLLLSQ